MRKRRICGASLVEVLVVIVILVVGIFSIVRLFPGGFLVLERGKEQAMAAQLNKQMLERLKGRLENLPEGIYPVKYTLAGGKLVLEVAFDSIHPSRRHKSGLAMRFPRISRIRWDKPAAEADRLEALAKLVEARATPADAPTGLFAR